MRPDFGPLALATSVTAGALAGEMVEAVAGTMVGAGVDPLALPAGIEPYAGRFGGLAALVVLGAFVGRSRWRASPGGRRNWLAVLLVGFALTAAASAAARHGLRGIPTGAVVHARVRLVTDAEPRGPGRVARGDVALARRGHWQVELRAYGRAGRALAARLAGEQVVVSGRVVPLSRAATPALRARHVAARLDVQIVEDWYPGSTLVSSANRVRAALARGAMVMPDDERALFEGLVIGDDRALPPATVDAFRRSGLAHLTAVSGENVAFVLVAFAPLLRRLGLRARWLGVLAVLGWFAVLTRFEPSVVRAAVMAAWAATSAFADRPASGVRLLALTVSASTMVDPFLVRSIGWWLSVGATAGIVGLRSPIARRLPGPRWLADPLATTLSAQAGVLPVSLLAFGSVPVVAPLTNLVAAPAAGPVMVWGLPAGVAAGLLPRPVAAVLHGPSVLLVRWIMSVARVGAAVPVGELDAVRTLALAVSSVVVLTVRREARRRRPAR